MDLVTKRTLEVLGRTNVHVDFHTPGHQKEVGIDFKGSEFAQQLKDASVDSVSLFAKDYHGLSYYDTKVGTKHPNLDFDLLKEAVKACHDPKIGIKVLAYLSIAFDTVAGIEHPHWLQTTTDGTRLVQSENTTISWLCLNTPYVEELFFPQIKELLDYDIDGFFFDELFYHENTCICKYCIRNMKAHDLDPSKPEDLRYFRSLTCDRFAENLSRLIKKRRPDLVIVYNPTTQLLGNMATLAEFEDCINVGGHETGWGYTNMPLEARYVRNYDRPVLGMTAIFHRRWGDFGSIKNSAQLNAELCEMLSHHFVVSVGDHMRPRGKLEKDKYLAIAEEFRKVKELKIPLAPIARPLRDIAVIYPGTYDSAFYVQEEEVAFLVPTDGLSGATKALLDLHQQFDVLDEALAAKLLNEFKLVILPETKCLDEQTVLNIRNFVKKGGSLIATGDSSLRMGRFDLEEVFGVRFSKYLPYFDGSQVYMKLNAYNANLPDMECNAYGDFLSVIPETAQVRATVIAPTAGGRPYSALYRGGPPEFELDDPAITYNVFGEGEVVYIAAPLFESYYAKSYHVHRTIINNILSSFKQPRLLKCSGPCSVKVNAMQDEQSIYLHLSSYFADDGGATKPRINSLPSAVSFSLELLSQEKKNRKVEALTNVEFKSRQNGDYLKLDFPGLVNYAVVRVAKG